MVQSFHEFMLAEQVANGGGPGLVSRIASWWGNRKAAKASKKAARHQAAAAPPRKPGTTTKPPAPHPNPNVQAKAKKYVAAMQPPKAAPAHSGWGELSNMGRQAMTAAPTKVTHTQPPKAPAKKKPKKPKKPRTPPAHGFAGDSHKQAPSHSKVTTLQFPRRK